MYRERWSSSLQGSSHIQHSQDQNPKEDEVDNGSTKADDADEIS
jgi:hypothetical protein